MENLSVDEFLIAVPDPERSRKSFYRFNLALLALVLAGIVGLFTFSVVQARHDMDGKPKKRPVNWSVPADATSFQF